MSQGSSTGTGESGSLRPLPNLDSPASQSNAPRSEGSSAMRYGSEHGMLSSAADRRTGTSGEDEGASSSSRKKRPPHGDDFRKSPIKRIVIMRKKGVHNEGPLVGDFVPQHKPIEPIHHQPRKKKAVNDNPSEKAKNANTPEKVANAEYNFSPVEPTPTEEPVDSPVVAQNPEDNATAAFLEERQNQETGHSGWNARNRVPRHPNEEDERRKDSSKSTEEQEATDEVPEQIHSVHTYTPKPLATVEHAGHYNLHDVLPDTTDPEQEHLCRVDIREPPHLMHKTRIICTIGPACRAIEKLKEMILSGMNIARMNVSHGSHEYHVETINNVRVAANSFSEPRMIAIALDMKGPEIRTGLLARGGSAEVELKKGDSIRLSTNKNFESSGTAVCLYVDYANISKVVKKGSKVFIDDGLLSLIVEEIDDDAIVCTVENGGMLGSRKKVNLPGTVVDLPAVSDKDLKDLQFGVEHDVDMIFASFIHNADGIRTIRKVLGEKGKNIKIIAKIENQEGVDNADELIAEADGIMVSRGELGIEIPADKVFLAQKKLIETCNRAGKPVICATQIPKSMVHKPCPTLAKGSDVAKAVLDGADCVMLSGETAEGDNPVDFLMIMHCICKEAEAAVHHTKNSEELLRDTPTPTDMAHTIAIAAISAAVSCHASAILVVTTTVNSAAFVSRYRPDVPIITISRNEQTVRQLHLYRGIFPLHYKIVDRHPDWPTDVDNRISYGIQVGKDRGFIQPGDCLVVLTEWREGANHSDTFRVIQAP